MQNLCFLCLWEHCFVFAFCCLHTYLRSTAWATRSRQVFPNLDPWEIRIQNMDPVLASRLADYGWWSALPWDEWTILASRRDNCQYIDQANTARIYNHHKEPKYESQICFTVCLTLYWVHSRYSTNTDPTLGESGFRPRSLMTKKWKIDSQKIFSFFVLFRFFDLATKNFSSSKHTKCLH